MTLTVDHLDSALRSVGTLVDGVRQDQWTAPTPCSDWTVRALVNHLVGMNAVFTAMLTGQDPPARGVDLLGDDPAGAYHNSGEKLLAAFAQPGLLEQTFTGPLGNATGADRLHIRMTDLLAHGWDLGRATGQPVTLSEDVIERALTFTRGQLDTMPRTGRFEPAQPIPEGAPMIDRLVAFLGRSPSWTPGTTVVG